MHTSVPKPVLPLPAQTTVPVPDAHAAAGAVVRHISFAMHVLYMACASGFAGDMPIQITSGAIQQGVPTNVKRGFVWPHSPSRSRVAAWQEWQFKRQSKIRLQYRASDITMRLT